MIVDSLLVELLGRRVLLSYMPDDHSLVHVPITPISLSPHPLIEVARELMSMTPFHGLQFPLCD